MQKTFEFVNIIRQLTNPCALNHDVYDFLLFSLNMNKIFVEKMTMKRDYPRQRGIHLHKNIRKELFFIFIRMKNSRYNLNQATKSAGRALQRRILV